MTTSTREKIEKRGNVAQGILTAAKINRRPNESYSLRRILEGPFALKIQLLKLYCHKTEDYFGYDNLSLDVFVDGEYQNSMKFRLKEGQSQTIGSIGAYHANNRISFHLFEHDDLDPDDFLGGHTIMAKEFEVNPISKVVFKNEGAKYDLLFEAKIEYHFPETANEIIEAFRLRTSRPVWSKIQRGVVADQLLHRLVSSSNTNHGPTNINQGATMFCGPTAVLFELARHMPKRYVKMVIDLYEKGFWVSASGTIKAPTGLLNMDIFVITDEDGTKRTTPAADWIALTSMRDSANMFFTIDEPDDVHSPIQGGALATEVAAWCPQLLGWRITYIYNTTQFGHFGFKLPKFIDLTGFIFTQLTGGAVDGLWEASGTIKRGGIAMLQIHSDLLKHIVNDPINPGDPNIIEQWLPPNYSSHFVSLYENKPFFLRNGRISVDFYSWGSIKKVEISREGYEREVFAYVFSKPSAPI